VIPDSLPSENGTLDLGFAKVDLDRKRRQGLGEVVFAEGKTGEQVAAILRQLHARERFALATRVSPDQAVHLRAALADLPLQFNATARIARIGDLPARPGRIAILAAGTSDLPVAEEAAVSATSFGFTVARHYDVGVAGLHRLLAEIDVVRTADVVIVVAGLEGALPSVVGGLVSHPVIAVPTSIGYGSSWNGLAALLGMLNSCAAGMTVVNIDNGFGAACAAFRILQAQGKGS
jgi:hypothetical protein